MRNKKTIIWTIVVVLLVLGCIGGFSFYSNGRNRAKASALKHAGLTESEVTHLETGMDYDYGKMVYEVDFESGAYEYDYKINATTGEVLYSHIEHKDDYSVNPNTVQNTNNGEKNTL